MLSPPGGQRSTVVLSSVLYEHPHSWFSLGRKRKRRFVLRSNALLESHPPLQEAAEQPPLVTGRSGTDPDRAVTINLEGATFSCSGLHITLHGPHIPRGTLELSAHSEAAHAQWVGALSRQLQPASHHQGSNHRDPADSAEPRSAETIGKRFSSGSTAGVISPLVLPAPSTEYVSPPSTHSMAPPRGPFSPGTQLPPALQHSLPPRAPPPRKVQQQPTRDRTGAVLIDVLKAASEQMGLLWEDHTRLAGVIAGSAAERGGAAQCVGWRVTHVNGRAVSRVRELKKLSEGRGNVLLRFVPPAAVRTHSIPIPGPEGLLGADETEVLFCTAKGGTVRVSGGGAEDAQGTLSVWYNDEPDPPCSEVRVECEPGKVQLFLGDEGAPFRLDVDSCPRVLGELRALAERCGVRCSIPDCLSVPLREDLEEGSGGSHGQPRPPAAAGMSDRALRMLLAERRPCACDAAAAATTVVAAVSAACSGGPSQTPELRPAAPHKVHPASPCASTRTGASMSPHTEQSARSTSPLRGTVSSFGGRRGSGGSPRPKGSPPVLQRRLGRKTPPSPVLIVNDHDGAAGASPAGASGGRTDLDSSAFDLSTATKTHSEDRTGGDVADPQAQDQGDLTTWTQFDSPTGTDITCSPHPKSGRLQLALDQTVTTQLSCSASPQDEMKNTSGLSWSVPAAGRPSGA
eukprot:TRINITY_DN14283_c0_g1_i1.p1 TRINITY_DN14283_c0_g1~~TRINITY_DN14283_c0_g1_i1.p1  ORF type:complete len:705 (+),score=176.39 TRINITY_DN14283_c0_g1_i1:63-2117(+)